MITEATIRYSADKKHSSTPRNSKDGKSSGFNITVVSNSCILVSKNSNNNTFFRRPIPLSRASVFPT